MPYHYNTPDKMKEKIDSRKEEKERKPRKKKQNELFDMKKLTKSQMDKLKEHSKLHKGGMMSKHMKNMVKFMKQGDSFSKAHNKAVKLDKSKK
tara:strand:- start:859 stop:1137 length:279 start_codon:yes stop_codon:yes gene_type:complete